MMLWSFPAFLRLLMLTAFCSRGTFARITPKRFFVMFIVLPLLLFGQVVHRLAFLLDDLLFGGYRKVEVKNPLFIVGIPRSGTTLLHRVIAQDTDNFTSMKLWEIVLAPSVVERRICMALGALDRSLGGFGRRFVVAMDKRFFRCLSEIHKVSLFDYDEDELALIPILSSVYLYFPFPFRESMWQFVRFDCDVADRSKERIMRFYKACVQRYLYVHGPEKRYLSKNPAFSAKVDALRTHFPGARVVCNMRSPYETVPSLLSALNIVWNVFDNDRKGDVFRDSVLELAGHWYRHPLHRLPEWANDQYAFLTYDELTRDLRSSVIKLYDRFALEVGPDFAMCLQSEHDRSQSYRSTHHYSLEAYGLTAEEVLIGFGDIFRRFGFSIDDPAGTAIRKRGA